MANPKAQPAPVDEAVTDAIEVGSNVRFLGYPAETPEAEMILELDGVYPVIQLPGLEDGQETGYVLQIPNPDYNSKKKIHPDTNPEFLETEVFEEEIELVLDEEGGEAGSGEGAEEDAPLTYEELAGYDTAELLEFAKANSVKLTAAEKKSDEVMIAKFAETFGLEPAEQEEPETPPAKPETAAAKKKREAAEQKAAEAEAAAKAAAKPAATGKGAVGKPAAAKPATKPAAAPKGPDAEVDPDEVPDLEGEDENVLALVEGQTDLVGVAQDLESQVSISEYQLGGVLYHIKKDKVHLRKVKGKLVDPEYGEPGGFKLFLQHNFNIDYRKATYLIDIYINFTQAGIENPSEVVGRIGWTKASKIAKPLGLPDADVEGLIDAAEQNTVNDLSEIIKEQFSEGGTGGTPGTPGAKKTRVTLKFRYVEEEGNVVEDILKEASDSLGVKPEDALYQILIEWRAQQTAGEQAEQETAPATTGRAAAKPRGAARARA